MLMYAPSPATARACKDFNPAGKTAAQKCPAARKGQEKNCAKMRTMYACVTRRVQTRRAGTVGEAPGGLLRGLLHLEGGGFCALCLLNSVTKS